MALLSPLSTTSLADSTKSGSLLSSRILFVASSLFMLSSTCFEARSAQSLRLDFIYSLFHFYSTSLYYNNRPVDELDHPTQTHGCKVVYIDVIDGGIVEGVAGQV